MFYAYTLKYFVFNSQNNCHKMLHLFFFSSPGVYSFPKHYVFPSQNLYMYKINNNNHLTNLNGKMVYIYIALFSILLGHPKHNVDALHTFVPF